MNNIIGETFAFINSKFEIFKVTNSDKFLRAIFKDVNINEIYFDNSYTYELIFHNSNIDYMIYRYSHVRNITVALSKINEFLYENNYEFVDFYNCYSEINDFNIFEKLVQI